MSLTEMCQYCPQSRPYPRKDHTGMTRQMAPWHNNIITLIFSSLRCCARLCVEYLHKGYWSILCVLCKNTQGKGFPPKRIPILWYFPEHNLHVFAVFLWATQRASWTSGTASVPEHVRKLPKHFSKKSVLAHQSPFVSIQSPYANFETLCCR